MTSLTAVVVRRGGSVDPSRSDPAQEPVVLRLSTDTGLDGLAECNHAPEAVLGLLAAPPSSSRGQGLRAVIGADPEQREQLVSTLYLRNWHAMRRGLGLAVLHALDVALADLQARARGVPLWRFLFADRAKAPVPYLSIYTGAGDFADTVARQRDMLHVALEHGYAGVKLEPLPECCPAARIAELCEAARAVIGDELPMLVDFGYRFLHAAEAVTQIRALRALRPALIETPLWIDDLAAWRAVADAVDVPLAGAEIMESPWELEALIERGGASVAQPWPNRAGISGTLRVLRHADAAGRGAMLGGWNATPIGDAASRELAAGLCSDELAIEHAPELLYPRSAAAIVSALPGLVAGRLPLSDAPGLGVVVDEEAWEFALAHNPHVSLTPDPAMAGGGGAW